MQIGLSFWVYQAVRQKKWIYLVAAYGLHALFDLARAYLKLAGCHPLLS